jgi:hypothetical protein
MGTGIISSPATWLNGTVASPAWFQQVQDNINGWLSGTNVLNLGTSATGVTPIVQYRNAAGNFRTGIDHTGYPTGHILTFSEFWPVSLSTTNSSTSFASNGTWTLAVGNAAGSNAINTQTGSATYPINSIQVTVGTNASDQVNVNHLGSYHSASTESVCEFDLFMDTIGANNVTLDIGMTLFTLFNGSNHGYYFEKTSANTNWQAVTISAGTSTKTDTGVPPVSNTPQRFRMEYHGSASPYGAATVLFFINDVLVATSTTNVTVNQSLSISFLGARTAANSTHVNLGMVRLIQNLFADPLTAL